MNGDKITGIPPSVKANPEFIKTLATLALSDAKHDFGKKNAYDENIEKIVKKGLPIDEAIATEIKSKTEEGVIDMRFGQEQGEFLAHLRANAATDLKLKLRLDNFAPLKPGTAEVPAAATSLYHITHTIHPLQLYNKKGKQALKGYEIVDKLGINNANLIVDAENIGIIAALKSGPEKRDRLVKYLLLSESYNDPATRPQFSDGKIFSKKEGIHLQPLLQNTKTPIKYTAFNPAIQSHYNDFFSKYDFTLSPVLAVANDKYTVTLDIKNPSSNDKQLIDNPKDNNAITAIVEKLKGFLKSFYKPRGSTPALTAEKVFENNIRYQQKRSGDWLQVLAAKDVLNRVFVNRTKDRDIYIDGETYLVTHDRIAMSYGILNGINVIFVNKSPSPERWIYCFKAVPKPRTSAPLGAVDKERYFLLSYFQDSPTSHRNKINNIIINANQYHAKLNTFLKTKYRSNITAICDELLHLSSPGLSQLKNLIRYLLKYIYIISKLPDYEDIANSLKELRDKHIEHLKHAATLSDDDRKKIRIFENLYIYSNNIINEGHNFNTLINISELLASSAFLSIEAINYNTSLDSYECFHYIRNYSSDRFDTYELRNLIVATFEKLLRLEYFEDIPETTDDLHKYIALMRLLQIGIIELSTNMPDAKTIQTFNDVLNKGVARLNEAEALENHIEELNDEDHTVADILLYMKAGQTNLISFHLYNDPIYRESSASTNPVAQLWYGETYENLTHGGGIGNLGRIYPTRAIKKSAKVKSTKGAKTRHHNNGRKHRANVSVNLRREQRAEQLLMTRRKGKTTVMPQIQFVVTNSIPSALGHHPLTPLLYLQYMVINGLQEHEPDDPDYNVYYALANIVDIFTKHLQRIMTSKSLISAFYCGLIFKYLLYYYIPSGYLDTSLDLGIIATNEEIVHLLSLLTDPIGLKTDKSFFKTILKRDYVTDLLSEIFNDIHALNLTTSSSERPSSEKSSSKRASFLAKLDVDIANNYSAIQSGIFTDTYKSRQRTRYIRGTRKRKSANEISSNNMRAFPIRENSNEDMERPGGGSNL